MIPVVK